MVNCRELERKGVWIRLNTTVVILGNVCTLFAMGANAFSATRKTARGVLGVQNVSQGIYAFSAFVLGGYSACAQNMVSILRNLAAMKNIKNKYLEWTLVALGVILGVAFNNRGFVGLLPVIGNLQYTLAIFRVKDNERLLKLSFLISVASFVVFNVVILNFVGAVSDLFVIGTTALVLLKGKKA